MAGSTDSVDHSTDWCGGTIVLWPCYFV